ncbi:MAG: SMI1/KNR4 family protein [Rickettsia endosymbiont of Ecitomorpha arachnoides]|nr:SMI1/KNR4 family protein [Rickettsia endosymbiont of Ecitomorpha arachnoides]
MEKYSYLRKYINNYTEPRRNLFLTITSNEIEEAEKKLNFKFPKILKEFWLEIGYGFLATSSRGSRVLEYTNRISDPSQIASIILEEEDAPIIPGISEYFH